MTVRCAQSGDQSCCACALVVPTAATQQHNATMVELRRSGVAVVFRFKTELLARGVATIGNGARRRQFEQSARSWLSPGNGLREELSVCAVAAFAGAHQTGKCPALFRAARRRRDHAKK